MNPQNADELLRETRGELEKTRKKLEETRIELEGHEGLLKLALEDMRKIYEDLLKTQAQLQQADKLATIGLIAAGVIHEINNPLAVVNGTVAVLAKYADIMTRLVQAVGKVKTEVLGGGDPAKAKAAAAELSELEASLNVPYIAQAVPELVESTVKGLQHAIRITGALKSFSRADRGEAAPENLNKILDDVIDIVWNQIKYKAKLEKEYGDVPPVVCSGRELCQVFMNLLINASHAISDRGVIKVKTFADTEWVCGEVTDTGSGIPPDVLPRIFEPFFTTKGADKGTGLGLSISADIVKRHKGEIRVRSEAGKGTTFTVCLPR